MQKKKKKKRGRMGTTPVQLEMLYISWKLTRANDRWWIMSLLQMLSTLKIPASPTNIHYQLRWKGKLSTSGSCKHSETEKLLYRGLSKSERYTSTFWMVCMDNQSIKKLDNNYMHAAQQYCPWSRLIFYAMQLFLKIKGSTDQSINDQKWQAKH